jgi:hypothetical protein
VTTSCDFSRLIIQKQTLSKTKASDELVTVSAYGNGIRRYSQRLKYIILKKSVVGTYDHRSVKTGHPVRSAIHKH